MDSQQPPRHAFPNLRFGLVSGCNIVTVIIYLLIAVFLVITVIVGAIDTVYLIIDALKAPSSEALSAVLQSILFLIVIATIIDMVRSYVSVGRVLIRPILIAGITTMVRRLLVNNLYFIDVIGITIVILGLTVALVYLGREDRSVTDFFNKKEKEYGQEEIAEANETKAGEKGKENASDRVSE